jgi:hypothetical protein
MNNAKAKAAFGERVAAWVWNHRRTGILACLGLTLLAGWFAKDVRVDNAIDIWFVADDPALVAYRDFQERFGNDEIVVVAFHDADGILDADGLRLVRRATRALAAVDGVARAESLATLPRLQASARGLEAVPVLPAGTISPKAAGALRDAITADPTLAGRLVSPDRTTALVLAHMASLTDMDSRRAAIIADMDATLQDLGAPYRMLGIGVIYEALNRLSMVDSGVLIVAAYGLTALLLWLLYGRVAPTLVTLGVVGAAVIWTMGAYRQLHPYPAPCRAAPPGRQPPGQGGRGRRSHVPPLPVHDADHQRRLRRAGRIAHAGDPRPGDIFGRRPDRRLRADHSLLHLGAGMGAGRTRGHSEIPDRGRHRMDGQSRTGA